MQGVHRAKSTYAFIARQGRECIIRLKMALEQGVHKIGEHESHLLYRAPPRGSRKKLAAFFGHPDLGDRDIPVFFVTKPFHEGVPRDHRMYAAGIS